MVSLTLMSFAVPTDKLAFVGFKGSFHPDWVHLEADADRAKIHQVLPVPVVHKMKLWVAGRVGRTAKRLCSPQILTRIHPPYKNMHRHTLTHIHVHTHCQHCRVSCSRPLVQDQVVFFLRFGSEKEWCDSMCWEGDDPLPEPALPMMDCICVRLPPSVEGFKVTTHPLAAILEVLGSLATVAQNSQWRLQKCGCLHRH